MIHFFRRIYLYILLKFILWKEYRIVCRLKKGYDYEAYLLYLNTSIWKSKKQLVLNRDKFKCRFCGNKYYLQCHHLTYDRLGYEELSDLITLCRSCHKRLHGK